jgi:hypothetical protein
MLPSGHPPGISAIHLALVRIAEAGHITDEHTVKGAKPARQASMIFRLSPACRELKQELNHVSQS